MAFVFGYSNLVASNGSVTAHQVNMTADWIVVDDGSGNTLRIPMTTTVTMDKSSTTQTSTLPNYRDQAATFPVSAWINIWAIYNPATLTIAGLFSLSATAPTLPSGYTHKAWVGAVYNSAGGNFVTFSQRQNQVALAETNLVTGGTGTGYISMITATQAAIPPSAIAVGGWAKVASAATNFAGYIYPTNTSGQGRAAFDLSAGVAGSINGNWRIVLVAPQTLYYSVPAGCAIDVWVTQWEY